MNKLIKNPIIYKITVDVLVLTLLCAFIFLTIETMLPGIISAHISSLVVFIFIFFLAFFISLLAHKQDISTSYKKTNKLFFTLSILIFFTFISIASFRFGIFLGITIAIFSTTILYLSHSALQETIHKN